jgi:subtilisin family serine protease
VSCPHSHTARGRRIRCALPIAVTAVLTAFSSPALSSGTIADGPDGASDVILVKVDPAAPSAEKREVGRRLGVAPDRESALGNGWRAYRLNETMTASRARALLKRADVAHAVEVNRRVTPFGIPNDPLWSDLWGLHNAQASAAWESHGAARQVVVAIADTGVQISHPDLSAAAWTNDDEIPGNGRDDDANGYVDDHHGWDFHNDDATVFDGVEDGHGTHVAGTIGATRGNSTGVAGIAGNVRLMSLKFMGADGGGTLDAIRAIDYAVANGAEVINASWGGVFSQALCDAVAAATLAGVVVVSAAGNGGADGIGDDVDGDATSPASCATPGNITVAAIDSANALTRESNYGGRRVDLGAPGASILSTAPQDAYSHWGGTSMAAPHVAGAVALLRGLDPALTPAQVEHRVRSTGVATKALGEATSSGRRLNLLDLVRSVGDPPPRQPGVPVPASPAHGAVVPGAAVRFAWAPPGDAGDGISSYELRIDGALAAVAEPTTTAVTRRLPDGRHSWAVVASGLAATEVPAALARTFTVDSTPPEPFIVRAPSRTRSPRPRLSWSTSDATSGLASYSVHVDGAQVAHGGPGFTRHTLRRKLSPGAHTLTVRATDAAGHSRTATARTVYRPAWALEPTPRPGRLVARRGRLLIPVAPSRLARRVVVTVATARGGRVRARHRALVRVPARRRHMRVRVPARILRVKGRAVVRWRRASSAYVRRYGRSLPWRTRVMAARRQR